ncbi:MAG TPA: EAL domain-containing protein [Polyangia bacterium]|nr:EAL domain-containing protein [Polyangia bacterium]
MSQRLATLMSLEAEGEGAETEVVRLKEEIFLLETLMDTIPDSIYFKDRQSRFTRINRYSAQRFGIGDPAQAIGRSDFDYFTDEHAAQAFRDEQEIVRTGQPLVNVEERETLPDGTVRWVSTTKMPLRDTVGKIVGTFGISRDITQRKEFERQLEHQAFFDPLTQMPNRALFMNRLQHLFHRARRAEGGLLFGVLYLDLDRFKGVNDGLGHAAGDELLVEIARRLEKCVRPSDTLARLGGDEFTVLLEDIASEADAVRVADRVRAALSTPFNVSGHEVFSSVSLGIALSSAHYERPEEMLRDADTAMYRAKANGRARHQVFDVDMHQRAVTLLRLETDLRRAIERRELMPYYQPIIDLQTRQLKGFEALARWQHPTRGLIMPDIFIPVAEETGLITSIGEFMLSEACRQMRVWQQRYPREKPLAISVNVSTKQLAQTNVAEQVQRVLTETGLPPASLTLEITESALIQNLKAGAAVIKQLHDMTVRLHIDDFGTGYSSLSYLHNFPVDTLKVDRSFVSQMENAPHQAEIVKAIVSLAQNLGMGVTAEGVETNAQADALQGLNCTSAQGFLFSRPLPAAEAERLIVNGIPAT